MLGLNLVQTKMIESSLKEQLLAAAKEFGTPLYFYHAEKIKEQQKRKLEVDMKQNQFWMSSLYEAYFYGSNPSEIVNKQKQVDELTSKMIQDAAKKYINLNSFIRATLKPDKQEEKPLKGF